MNNGITCALALMHAEGGGGFLHAVLLDGLLDTLKLLPFLFLTYLCMEFIEHKASDKAKAVMGKAGGFAPALGALLGAVPQCGFSAAAANLYTGRVIGMGALIAVFLSTSDEMLPVMLSSGAPAARILLLIAYKVVVGLLVGYAVTLVCHIMHRDGEEMDIDRFCESDGCHCERGILRSALHHTAEIIIFVLIINLLLNAGVYFLGEERIAGAVSSVPVLGYFISALIGLVPNCAASVVLTELYVDGMISAGTAMAGLLTAAGVGIAILFRVNRKKAENFVILGIVYASGVAFGALLDLPFISALL